MKKLFVGNIPFSLSESELRDIFSEIGSIESCKLIMDSETGRSRGFGFVEYETPEQAQEAIDKFDSFDVQGKKLVVNKAKPRERRQEGGRGHRPPRRQF